MKNPHAIVPPGSMAARNCFNFIIHHIVEGGEDYVISQERVIETESPPGRLVPGLPETCGVKDSTSGMEHSRKPKIGTFIERSNPDP